MSTESSYRQLPSVDEVLARMKSRMGAFPRQLIVGEIRQVLEAEREAIRAGRVPFKTPVEEQVEGALDALARPSLRPVINATGVVLHTNLGRAPLAAFQPIAGYSNLEYDIAAGKRGKRDVHASGLIERLLGKPGIAVNNNAAAVFLALNELAAGGEVIVSRGELIEIGDGFRIPDIMVRSGAILREVGTTNRTRVDDYSNAFSDRTKMLLRVHASNFRIQGFTEQPDLRELAALAKEKGVPLYEDLGSGCIADLRPYGIDEPLAADSLRQGVNLVSFSGDKLLGGPQAGILAGDPELVSRLRRNPMFRALRLDKLIYQALEGTLRDLLLERWDRIPALRMIRMTAEEIRERAEKLLKRMDDVVKDVSFELVPGQSVIGGGATPEQSLPTWLISIQSGDTAELERKLRLGSPAVIGRLERERLLLDLRTVLPEEEPALAESLIGSLNR